MSFLKYLLGQIEIDRLSHLEISAEGQVAIPAEVVLKADVRGAERDEPVHQEGRVVRSPVVAVDVDADADADADKDKERTHDGSSTESCAGCAMDRRGQGCGKGLGLDSGRTGTTLTRRKAI